MSGNKNSAPNNYLTLVADDPFLMPVGGDFAQAVAQPEVSAPTAVTPEAL